MVIPPWTERGNRRRGARFASCQRLQPWHHTDHSTPPTAGVKNKWRYNFTPLYGFPVRREANLPSLLLSTGRNSVPCPPSSLTLSLITFVFHSISLHSALSSASFRNSNITVLGINLDTWKHDEYDDDFRLALYFKADCTTSWFAVIKNVQSHLTRNVHCDRS